MGNSSVGNGGSRAHPDRHRQWWILDRVGQGLQGIGVESRRGIDLKHRKYLTPLGGGLDRSFHELQGRGVERAADVDDIDPTFLIGAKDGQGEEDQKDRQSEKESAHCV